MKNKRNLNLDCNSRILEDRYIEKNQNKDTNESVIAAPKIE